MVVGVGEAQLVGVGQEGGEASIELAVCWMAPMRFGKSGSSIEENFEGPIPLIRLSRGSEVVDGTRDVGEGPQNADRERRRRPNLGVYRKQADSDMPQDMVEHFDTDSEAADVGSDYTAAGGEIGSLGVDTERVPSALPEEPSRALRSGDHLRKA